MQDKEYEIRLTKQAQKLFNKIKDRREQEILLARLEKLKYSPEQQGKALTRELSGYRSIRAVGQRYRIVYQVQEKRVFVLIVAIGRRKEGGKKDIYTITKKLLDNFDTSDD